MEHTDRERILDVLKSNIQLKRLYDEHLHLEDRLSVLTRKSFLTPQEQMEERRLKKLKLRGVDRMMDIISPERTV